MTLNWRKHMGALAAFLLAVMLMSGDWTNNVIQAEAADDPIYLEGAKLENSRTLVPMRAIFEELDANVRWDGTNRKVFADRSGVSLELTIGSRTVLKNNQRIQLDTAAAIYDSRTYIPLRFVSESLGAKVQWNQSDRAATIEDPATGKTLVVYTGNGTATASAVDNGKWNVNRISIGDSEAKVRSLLGSPQRTTTSEYGFTWQAYHSGYRNFMMVGINGGEVVALYTNADLLSTPEGIAMEQSRDSVRRTLGERVYTIVKGNTRYSYHDYDNFDLFKTDDGYATVFYDQHRRHTVTAVQLVSEETELAMRGYFGTPSDELRRSFELQMFDLVNADRVKYYRPALQWSDSVASVSRNHSRDMADRNYFAHSSPDGVSPFDRLRNAGLSYRTAGENIAAGHTSAVFAQQGLMNSEGHRRNLLNENYRELGTGVAFNTSNRPYYTQKFYTPR